MEIISEIFRENIPIEGRILKRDAVRAVVLSKNKKLLMVYSIQRGDYKFPEGGVQKGETHEDALKREVKEECGLKIDKIIKEMGMVIEYKKARDPGYDIFQMNSYYYLCRIKRDKKEQDLDDYEKVLGFSPVWINFQKALVGNKKI